MILTVMAVFLVIGVLVLAAAHLLTEAAVFTIVHWALVVYGVFIIIGNVPGLISGIIRLNERMGRLDFVSAVLGIVLGILLVFFQNTVLVSVIAFYLVVFPILRLVFSPDRKARLWPELIRIALGVLVLLFLPALTSAAFTVFRTVLLAAGWIITGLAVAFGLVGLVRVALEKDGSRPQPSGSRKSTVYVDTTGDGVVDTMYVDTTGDGRPDTEVRLDKKK